MPETAPAIPTSAIKDKRKRSTIEHKLREVVRMNSLVKLITNPNKTGELDIIKGELTDLLMSEGIEKASLDGYSHTVFVGSTSTLSKDRLRDALMKHRVDVDIIPMIIKDSTATSTFTTLRTTEIKS
jgi:hypothetical protein